LLRHDPPLCYEWTAARTRLFTPLPAFIYFAGTISE
jgi:hypothetical protein